MHTSVKRSGVLLAGAVLASLALSSCTKKATEEQLDQIHSLRREIASLENAIKQNDSEKARLSGELASLQQQLSKCNDDMNFVKSKLAQWPDVWPDWHPAPPPSATPTETPKKK